MLKLVRSVNESYKWDHWSLLPVSKTVVFRTTWNDNQLVTLLDFNGNFSNNNSTC